MKTLVDSNVLLDVLTDDPHWYTWSASAIAHHLDNDELIINPLILSEVSVGFERIEDLHHALSEQLFTREPLPWEAAFLAGKAFVNYRKNGGTRRSPLPDFYIGAHAAVRGYRLLTRDRGRYSTYFSGLEIISPH